MAELLRAPSKRMFSWWWDSHNSPKNSKWLQENLTDMDTKVKAMIKLIEEDADSFARRAEMYYEKRPELMKLVEEFYRAYRALAERYDNATGVLRQAQCTMSEEFSNQDPLGISDGSPENLEIKKKGLNCHEDLSDSVMMSNFAKEIRALKDALAQLELEKEAGIIEYEQSLEKLSKLEDLSKELNDRANRAEGGVQVLKASLTKVEAEKEASLLEYQNCLVKIANLENNLSQANERASKAEYEKDEALDRYNQSLEMKLILENNLNLAEVDARQLSQRADNAEREVENLKQALAKLSAENKSTIQEYNKCLEKISISENELSCAENEVQRLKGEIDLGVTKLKDAEELCVSLEKSNQGLNSELGSQSEELKEKKKELGKIWPCLQEERSRFVEAETAFQTLQQLHSQTQDQLRSLYLELENKGQLLRDTQTRNESLSNEMLRLNEENKSLNECNLSSCMTIKEMHTEISGSVESKKRLVELVQNRVDQRNSLQEYVYCLEEDINELERENGNILKQLDAVGLNPVSFVSSVKFQVENSDLKEIIEKEKAENLLLLKKLGIMDQLLKKKILLKKSLSDLMTELEGARGNISALEQSLNALLEEKSANLVEKAAIMSQLQAMIENLGKISDKNKTLEDSCQSLEKENICLINEKDTLVSQGKTIQQTLEALGKRQWELEERYSGLEREREYTFTKLEELGFSLGLEKRENAIFVQRTKTQLAGMGKQICVLQEEVFSRRREFEEELDTTMNYQLEIFILQRCIEDLKEKYSSLLFLSQNEANKLQELNRGLNLKVSEFNSLKARMKREIDEENIVSNNRENQIEKFCETKDGVTSKDGENELMEKNIGYLEGENGRLEAQLASYTPLIMSLKDSVSSLARNTLRTKLQKSQNEGAKEVVSMYRKNENADKKVLDVYSELKDMHYKLKVIERAFVQKENLDNNTNLELAKKSNDGLKIRTCANRSYSVRMYEHSEFEDEIMLKDIILDKNSESSSYELSRLVEGKSQSKRVESWDSTDLDQSIDLAIGKDKMVKSPSRQKNKFRSSVIEAKKELGVEKLEMSRTFSHRSQEASKTKILERLNVDAQKLKNLQFIVQDLMKKVEISEKGRNEAVNGSDTLREQLEEAEEGIMDLSDFNGKLMRSVEKRSFFSNVKLGVDSEESGSAIRRRISEQARKMSEKIERWQTKVQKIQFLLLKENEKNEKETKGISPRKRVMLRDYLYGALRTPSHELRKKRSSFCVCVQPSIRGD